MTTKPAISSRYLATKPCGCMEMAISVREGDDWIRLAEFKAEAWERKLKLQVIPPGEPMPDWLCPKHRAEREAKKGATP